MTFPIPDFDFDRLARALERGLIRRERHPEFDLEIYNYTSRATYQRVWTPETRACRGLILDRAQRLVARPFPKFFGVDQLPGGLARRDGFRLYDKLDGSLGILYTAGGLPRVATRGSFVSEQAEHATRTLWRNYPDFVPPPGWTYLVEIIYPTNKIVVDYGTRDEVVLLAVIENATGRELPLDDAAWPGPVVEQFVLPPGARIPPARVLEHFAFRNDGTAEGFVACFDEPDGSVFRIKLKHDEYVRLHRLITMTNTTTVWEYLSQGWSFDELTERVPDEFHGWLAGLTSQLRADYAALDARARALYERCCRDADPADRKAFAALATATDVPELLFALLDANTARYERGLWQRLKPDHDRPYFERRDEEA